MTKATAEWVQKAEDDWFAANQLSQGSRPLHDHVSFHCQQCAEKYLKALLQEVALAIPRTHGLVEVLDLLLPHHRTLPPCAVTPQAARRWQRSSGGSCRQ